MAKLTNIRERVQQPFRDALLRTSGLVQGSVQDQNSLFQNNNNAKTVGDTNLRSGNVLPSDQSMIILALRCMLWFRNSIVRSPTGSTGTPSPLANGDIASFPNAAGQPGFGNANGNVEDVFRLYQQSAEQLYWTFGAGEKPSITQMPSIYFPQGGAVVMDLGATSDIINGYNGDATHESILKLARAILLVPRQQINCLAQIVKLSDGGNGQAFGTTQGGRNMLSLTDNLNAVDAVQKVITFTFDGLLSRDVQLSTCPASRRGSAAPTPAVLAHGGEAWGSG